MGANVNVLLVNCLWNDQLIFSRVAKSQLENFVIIPKCLPVDLIFDSLDAWAELENNIR